MDGGGEMSGHTKGPWIIRRSGSGKPYQVETVDGVGITQWRGISRPASKEGEANAHLIAAAPDLLEALEACVGLVTISYHESAGEIADKVYAAIAKARGEA